MSLASDNSSEASYGEENQKDDTNADEELLMKKNSSKAEEAIFGILSAIFHQGNVTWHFSVVHLILDYAQLIYFVTLPFFPWGKTTLFIYKNYTNMVLLGNISLNDFSLYQSFWITIVTILLFSCLLFILTYRNFRDGQIYVMKAWFINLCLHRFILPFFDVCYVTNLSTLLMALDCDTSTFMNLNFNPSVSCSDNNYLAIMISSVFFTFIYIACSFALMTVKLDVIFPSRVPLACRLGLMNQKTFLFKTMLCFAVFILKGINNFYLATVIFYLCIKLLENAINMRGYQRNVFNFIAITFYSCLTWMSFMQLIVFLFNYPQSDLCTIIMACGLVPTIIISILIHFRDVRRYDLDRWIMQSEEDANAYSLIREFNSEVDVFHLVEKIMHVGLKEEDEEATKDWINKVDTIFEFALQTFNQSSTLNIYYAFYVLNVKKDTNKSQFHLDQASCLKLTIQERFIIFMHELMTKLNRSFNSAGNTDDTSKMDVVSYLEFQGFYQNALKSHRQLISTIKMFWKLLAMSDNPSTNNLSHVLGKIDLLEVKCTSNYQFLKKKYPTNVSVLRSYASFLENIQNDKRKSSYIQLEADRITEEAEAQRKLESFGAKGGDDQSSNGVDDKLDTIIVINEVGMILSVNKNAMSMFGHKEKAMVGRNISMIMPSPYKQQHASYMQKYKKSKSQKSSIIGYTRRLLAEHRKGYTFDIELRVSRVDTPSGVTFIGIIHPLEEKTEGLISINKSGIILNVSRVFLEMFGYSSGDLLGKNIKIIMPEEIAENHDNYLRDSLNRGGGKMLKLKENINMAARSMEGLHKTGVRFPILLSIHADPTFEKDGMSVIIGKIVKVSDQVGYIVISDKGKIKVVSEMTARIFGYNKGVLIGQNIKILMPEPYASFHDTYLSKIKEPNFEPIFLNKNIGRVVYALHNDGSQFPVHLQISEVVDHKGKISYSGILKPINRELEISNPNDLILKTNSKGIISFANSNWTNAGYSATDLVGQNVKALLPNHLAQKHDDHISNYFLNIGERAPVSFINNNLEGRKAFIKGGGVEFFQDLLPVNLIVKSEKIENGETVFEAKLTLLNQLESIVEIDSAGVIIDCNPDACVLFGYNKKDLLENNVSILMPAEVGINHDNYLSNYLVHQEKRMIGSRRYVTAVNKSQEQLSLFIEVVEITNNNFQSNGFIARMQLINENKRNRNTGVLKEDSVDFKAEVSTPVSPQTKIDKSNKRKSLVFFKGGKQESIRFEASSAATDVKKRKNKKNEKLIPKNSIGMEVDETDFREPPTLDLPLSPVGEKDNGESKTNLLSPTSVGTTSPSADVNEKKKSNNSEDKSFIKQLQKLNKQNNLRMALDYLALTRNAMFYMLSFIVLISCACSLYLNVQQTQMLSRIVLSSDRVNFAIEIATQARLLQIAYDNRDLEGIMAAQSSLNTLSNSLEVNHRTLFIGVTSLSPVVYQPLIDHYINPNILLYSYNDLPLTFSQISTTTNSVKVSKGLWEAMRLYISSAWVLAFQANGTTTMKYDRNFRFIIFNVDTVVVECKKNLNLEIENMNTVAESFRYVQLATSILIIVLPILISLFIFKPVFQHIYEERLYMFFLFTCLPKKMVYDLSRINLAINDGESMGNGGESEAGSQKDDGSSIGDGSSVGDGKEEGEENLIDLDDQDLDEDKKDVKKDNNKAKAPKKVTKAEKAKKIQKRLEDILGPSRAAYMLNNRYTKYNSSNITSDNEDDNHDDLLVNGKEQKISKNNRCLNLFAYINKVRASLTFPPILIVVQITIVILGIMSYLSVVSLVNLSRSAIVDSISAANRRVISSQIFFKVNEVVTVNYDSEYVKNQQAMILELISEATVLHHDILFGDYSLSSSPDSLFLFTLDQSLYRPYYSQDNLLFSSSCLRNDLNCDGNVVAGHGLDTLFDYYIEMCRAISDPLFIHTLGSNASMAFIKEYGPNDLEDGLANSILLFNSEANFYINLNSGVEALKLILYFIAVLYANKHVFDQINVKTNADINRSSSMLCFIPDSLDLKELKKGMKKKLNKEKGFKKKTKKNAVIPSGGKGNHRLSVFSIRKESEDPTVKRSSSWDKLVKNK